MMHIDHFEKLGFDSLTRELSDDNPTRVSENQAWSGRPDETIKRWADNFRNKGVNKIEYSLRGKGIPTEGAGDGILPPYSEDEVSIGGKAPPKKIKSRVDKSDYVRGGTLAGEYPLGELSVDAQKNLISDHKEDNIESNREIAGNVGLGLSALLGGAGAAVGDANIGGTKGKVLGGLGGAATGLLGTKAVQEGIIGKPDIKEENVDPEKFIQKHSSRSQSGYEYQSAVGAPVGGAIHRDVRG